MILIAKNWWSLAVRGLLGILLGIVSFIWPGITLTALVTLFGIYALLDGVLNLAGAWHQARQHERWGVFLLQGIIGVLVGIVTLGWPAITAVFLVLLIATWAVVTGIFQIVAAFRLRRHISGEWLLALIGVISVLFGIALWSAPLAGAVIIAFWVGAYAFIAGVSLLALAFRLRNWQRNHPTSLANANLIR
jgi:uncharacterized membrane protein HdeD (DUF308 family)